MPVSKIQSTLAAEERYEREGFQRIHGLEPARLESIPRNRLEAVRSAARRLRESMRCGPMVACYQSRELVRVPYPARYAYLNANTMWSEFVSLNNRLFLIQFKQNGALKTLLFSPSDVHGNRETPFFRRLGRRYGMLEGALARLLSPVAATVEDRLAEAGLAPEDVDYISYDHLHTQDLRKWIAGDNPLFPNAKLLVMREEWDAVQGLLAPQTDWYCPGGAAGVPMDRIILLDHDVRLGDGVALIRSPGHTMGNHSLAVHTPEGVLVTSENGVSADSFAPLHSRIKGVRQYARDTGHEVILNGNTLEGGLDQYVSMVMEKELAGPSPRDPDFCNFVPSSEVTAFWAFPGTTPAFNFGDLSFGAPLSARSARRPEPQIAIGRN